MRKTISLLSAGAFCCLQFQLFPSASLAQGSTAVPGAYGNTSNLTGMQTLTGGPSALTGAQTTTSLPTGMSPLGGIFGGAGTNGLPPTSLDSFVYEAGGQAELIYGDEGVDDIPPYFEFDKTHRINTGITGQDAAGLSTGHSSMLPDAWGGDEWVKGPEWDESGNGSDTITPFAANGGNPLPVQLTGAQGNNNNNNNNNNQAALDAALAALLAQNAANNAINGLNGLTNLGQEFGNGLSGLAPGIAGIGAGF